MGKYRYLAINQDAERVNGTVSASNIFEVEESLKKQNLVILSIQEDIRNNFKNLLNKELTGISFKDKIVILTQVYTMMSSGININTVFEILINQKWKASLGEKLRRIYNLILSGKNLSEAFTIESGILNNVEVSLIRAGEKSGNLVEILRKIKDDNLKNRELRSRIKSALIYPSIILVVIFVVVFIMIFFMVPQVKLLYSSFGVDDLPIPTSILITVANFFLNPLNLVVLFLVVIFLILAIRYYYSTLYGRIRLDRMILRMPIFGSLLKGYSIANSMRILSMLLESGLSIIDALDITANSLSNKYFSDIIVRTKNAVTNGKALSVALTENNDEKTAYPQLLVAVLASAEESGSLVSVLNDMYTYFMTEVSQMGENLTKSIEPFMLIVVGLLVAFMALAVYLPIYQAGNLIGF